jgi:hypothetical protein
MKPGTWKFGALPYTSSAPSGAVTMMVEAQRPVEKDAPSSMCGARLQDRRLQKTTIIGAVMDTGLGKL